NSLPRSIIRQAEDHDVGFIERLFPRSGILAPVIAQRNEAEIIATIKPRTDFEPRCPRFAVDENLGGHVSNPFQMPLLCRIPPAGSGGQARYEKGASFPRSAFSREPVKGISASRTGSCGGPSPCRTSCVQPYGCRASGSQPS